MTTMNLNIPEDISEFIEVVLSRGDYPTADEYLAALIREDRGRQARRELASLLQDGTRGERVEMTPDDWESIRREAIDGLAGEPIRP